MLNKFENKQLNALKVHLFRIFTVRLINSNLNAQNTCIIRLLDSFTSGKSASFMLNCDEMHQSDVCTVAMQIFVSLLSIPVKLSAF